MISVVKFIVDSTCDLPEDLIIKSNISLIPLKVLIDDKDYLDKKTINVDEVYSAMRRGILPKTSQPNPKDMYDIFEECCNKGEDFIFLSFSSALSGTYRLAKTIVLELKERYPKINMEVIDSKSGSTATGLIILEAIKFTQESGHSFYEIVGKIRNLVTHIEHVFTIADLNWLIKGGRIGKTQGVIGNILDIKPILDVSNGEMEIIQKVRGKKKALHRMVDILEERAGNYKEQIIGVSHADDIETAEELVNMIKIKLGYKQFIINKIGSVLGSHLGIGGVGIFFFNDELDKRSN
ncbi:DegV family protein [Clostridium sp. YIM B02565]|uniref:DegV family protein n=1 Tax=Clostridium paridis TaxID=2803863 RepID=A0A937FG68_9CLOT|nr:DegV family protein [Clostridium paridis]MBL4931682.1 DegV family protein [Clostridium paridis]